MKRLLLYLSLMIVVISFSSCDDDEKPKTIPEVSVPVVSDVATNSAVVEAEVIGDGNSEITSAGFVFSDAVSVPTIADDKIEVTIASDEFGTLLEHLKSGTTYYVRAYAVNSVGMGYGEVIEFTTGNAAPMAASVTIAGDFEVNKQLTATYNYVDSEGDVEGSTIFQWYIAHDNAGTGQVPIAGATSKTYTVQEAAQGKYLSVAVKPIAVTGATEGTEVKSAFFGAIGEATTVTFIYNGQEVTYGIITSTTGKKWLDRNLGAPNAPSTVDDFADYGDLFQWGRAADGHQVLFRKGLNDTDMSGVNGTTSFDAPQQPSSTDNPGHSKFIIYVSTWGDWRQPKNDNLWQGVNGINNPCPPGWRIPTLTEWAAENLVNLTTAFSKLKLTYTGLRFVNNAAFGQSTTSGIYWTSTVDADTPDQTTRIRFNPNYASLAGGRGNGYACRCIKN